MPSDDRSMRNRVSEKTEDEARRELDRQSYIRWQEITRTQVTFTVNVVLGLAVAALGFGVKVMIDSNTLRFSCVRSLFYSGLALLLLSITFALVISWNRLFDFRYSQLAARARWKKLAQEYETYHTRAAKHTPWTWRLLPLQLITFALGILLISVSLWILFGNGTIGAG